MNTIQKFAKNAAALYAANLVTALVLLSLSVVIARMMGDAAFGKYSLALTLATILTTFISLGYDTLLFRDVARDRSLAPRYLGNFLLLAAILAVAFYGVMVLSIWRLGYPSDTVGLVAAFGVYGVFASFGALFKVTFRAFERMEFEAVAEIAGRIVTASLAMAAVLAGYSLAGVAAAFLAGGITDLAVSAILCYRRVARPAFGFDRAFLKQATKSALPIGFLSISAIVLARVNTVMLSAMAGDAVVGWYNAGANLVLALKPVPFVLATIILPFMSRAFNTGAAALNLAAQKALYYLFTLGLPLAIGISLLSGRIIILLYGPAFAPAADVLRILGWEVLLFFIYMPLGTLLISIDRQNDMAFSCVIAAGANILLNLLIIPIYGYIGAGFVTLFTEGLLSLLYLYFTARRLHALPSLAAFRRPAAAGAAMGIFIYLFHDFELIALVAISAAIYLAALLALRAVPPEDMTLVRQVVRVPWLKHIKFRIGRTKQRSGVKG